jgi:hypothetical protein
MYYELQAKISSRGEKAGKGATTPKPGAYKGIEKEAAEI